MTNLPGELECDSSYGGSVDVVHPLSTSRQPQAGNREKEGPRGRASVRTRSRFNDEAVLERRFCTIYILIISAFCNFLVINSHVERYGQQVRKCALHRLLLILGT